jgi:hypothetical protein
MRRAIWIVLLAGCGGAGAAGGTTPEAPRRECTAALRFEEPDETAPVIDDRPRTDVSLVLICEGEGTRRVAIGAEVGACFGSDAGDALLRARCWWGGDGAILEVRTEDDALVVRRAGIDEEGGAGALEETARLPLPEGAHVQPL